MELVLLFFVTVGQVTAGVFTCETVRIARNVTERPFVYVKKMDVRHFEMGRDPIFAIRYENGGKSPAANVWVNFSVIVIPTAESVSSLRRYGLNNSTHEPHGPFLLNQGESRPIETSVPIAADEYDRIAHGLKHIYFLVWFEYDDILGGHYGKEGYCYTYVRPPLTGVFSDEEAHFVECDDHEHEGGVGQQKVTDRP